MSSPGLHYTAAPSSRIKSRFRITKPPTGQLPKSLRRTSTPTPGASPPAQQKLQDTGRYIPSSHLLHRQHAESPTDVQTAITHIQQHLFSPLPENFKGLTRAKVAKILTFRSRIPPYVPIPLIHALLNKPTATTRCISELCSRGELRKILLPNRERSGDDGGVAPATYLYGLIEESELKEVTKRKFMELLRKNPEMGSFPEYLFEKEEARELLDAGFLVLGNALQREAAMGVEQKGGKGTITSLAAIAASGTEAAVGGKGAVTVHGIGALGTMRVEGGGEYVVSLPTLGPLLSLLSAARGHFLGMLRKEKGKGGVTEKTLRERWDGGIVVWKGKKWKELKGLDWESVVGECLGRGECEVFDAGSMGYGLRLR